MRAVLRWGLRGLALLLALSILLAGAAAFVLSTNTGTRWALARIDAALKGELIVAEFAGSFWSGMELPSVRYRDANYDIDASAAEVRIDWSALLAGNLALSDLHAASLQIRRRGEPPAEPRPFSVSMTPLPFELRVTRGTFGEVMVPSGSESRRFSNVSVRSASVRGDTIRAATASATTAGINMNAERLRLTLAGDARAAAQVSWALAEGGWSGQGSLRGSLALLSFEQDVDGPYPFAATGTVQLLQQIEAVFAAEVSWQDWNVLDYRVQNGRAQFQGSTTQYEVSFQALVQTPDTGQLQLAGTGSGNLQQLDSFDALVQAGFGRAQLAGTLAWLPQFIATAEVHANDVDPAFFAPQYNGSLAADARLNLPDSGDIELDNLAVRGTLNGAPVDASGNLRFAPRQLYCASCALAVGNNRLRVDGLASDIELDLSLSVDAPELQQLWPELSGSARGNGRLRGSLQQPQFSGVLNARAVSIAGYAAESIAINSDRSSLESLHAQLDIAALTAAGTDYGSFSINASGPARDLGLNIGWSYQDLQIDAAGTLQSDAQQFHGRITRATLNDPRTGLWHTQSPFEFSYAGQALSVTPHAWSGRSGHVQLMRFDATAEETHLLASIENFPMSMADLLLPPSFHLLGEASAEIDLTRRTGIWSGTVDWQQRDTVLHVTESDTQSTEVRIPRADLHADFADGGVTARAALLVEPGVSSELDLRLSTLDETALMQAELRLSGEDWSWIPAVVPEIDSFGGRVSAALQAKGPLRTPELSGNLEWRDGGVLLPALNVPLSDISLVVAGAPRGTASIQGTARAGDGTLAVTGSIERLMQPSRTMTLHLTGKSALLSDWPEYRVWGSPDMQLVGDVSGWRFSGDLPIPRAAFEIREIPVEAVTVSPDVVVIGAEDIVVTPTRISGEARLRLGNDVRVKALGLDTGLSGELLVRVTADRSMSAEGRISLVNGSFAAQGQNLKIQNGELTFTGPLDNPIVDVRAVRVIDNFDGTVTAGIHLHGRAQDLTSTVFSEPAMNDVDALSYLVIGRPLNQATESEGNQLSGAAVSLGLRQATRLTEQIGQSIGLDQLSLSGDGGDSTTLIAGKKINSRLYARYAYGIFSRLGTLLLRYRLSDRLTLEAGAGENQSIDILYSVEQH